MPLSKIEQSSVNSGVAGTGPAFSAYLSSNQTGIVTATFTKVTFDTEYFDTNSNFSSSRFTPTVAGYYLLTAKTTYSLVGAATQTICVLYKNGSDYGQLGNIPNYTTAFPSPNGAQIVYANGTTDYFEIYTYQNSGSNATLSSGNTYFSGFLARAA